MDTIEFQWLQGGGNLKEALQQTLGTSGQLLKRHLSSKQLGHIIEARETVRLPLDLVNHLKINPSYLGPAASIIKETDNYIAVHKPPGIHSHPLRYSDRDTVLNFLASEKKWEALNVNLSNFDRGLLYRLDQETSGVIVLAKKEALFKRLREEFHEQVKRKLYLAVVDEGFDDEGAWTHYFRATGLKGAKQKVSTDPHVDATAGTIRIRKLQEQNGKTLLLINLKTGLRHQIRGQLSALGFPILGDELYGGHKADRLYLHAWRYEWDDESIEDDSPELFGGLFDLHCALQVGHDVIRTL